MKMDKKKIMEWLSKAKEYITSEPDKCLIYIELVEKHIKESS
jgi:hypothetical protein